MYIGPKQYFVITDIGRGRYQWYVLVARPAEPAHQLLSYTIFARYAFLARPADSEASEAKPEGMGPYLRNLFEGR